MHSPVWQDYHPSFDTAEIWSDWEYYSDDYYDVDVDTPRRKRKPSNLEVGTTGEIDRESAVRRRRRKLRATDEITGMSLGDPLHSDLDDLRTVASVIVWRSKTEADHIPVVSEGQGEKVALLKDWRERFKVPFQPRLNLLQPKGMARRDSQKAVAVVIEQKANGNSVKGIPCQSKIVQTRANSTATTASSTAKQRPKVTQTLKPATATKSNLKSSSRRIDSTIPANKAPINGLKRKALTLTEDNADPRLANGDFKELDGSKKAMNGRRENGSTQALLNEPTTSERPKKRGRPKADTSIPSSTSGATTTDHDNGSSRGDTRSGFTNSERARKADLSTLSVVPEGSIRSAKDTSTNETVLESLPNVNTSFVNAGISKSGTSEGVQPEATNGSLRKRKATDLPNGNAEPSSKRKAPDLTNGDGEPRPKRTASKAGGRPPARVKK